MAKSMKRHRKHSGSRRKRMRGGYSQGVNPAATSATFNQGPNAEGGAQYVEARYGDTNQQYNDVFDIGSKTQGNSFTTLPDSQTPTPQSLQLIQSAGRRRRKHKAGMGALETAIVPFGLLAAHNKYGRRTRKRRTRKSRKSRKTGKSRKVKSGGMLGQIPATAAVHLTLLGAHNIFGRKARKGKKSRKFRK